MRHFPGWVVGALGTTAVVGAFYAGGAVKAADSATRQPVEAHTAAAAATDPSALEIACEPGQRAVVRQASPLSGGSVACVSVAGATVTGFTAAPGVFGATPGAAVPVSYMPTAASVQPAVNNEPIEVYRPRAVPARYQTREVARPTRSVKKSVAIIAGSTAAGAVVGGLAKGKKGALIGGIVGGGAATVWDQVTRRRDNGR